jgi:hypothetical protein
MDQSYLHLCVAAQGSLATAFEAVGRAVCAMPGWAAAAGEGSGDGGYRVWRHRESGAALLAVAVGLDPVVLSIGRDPATPGAGERAARAAVAAVRRAVPAIGGREVADWELLPLVRQAQERLEWRARAEAGGRTR